MQKLTRTTEPTIEVLQVLLASTAPVWGLQLAKETGRPTGTIYPVLARLEDLGWVEGEWEDAPERKGPRRRLYRITAGATALAAEAIESRRRTSAPAATRPAPATATATALTLLTAQAAC